MSSDHASFAISLYELLDALEAAEEGAALPKGTTRQIKTDIPLVLVIAEETGLDAGHVYTAFHRRPVRQTRAIIAWIQREAPDDLQEQAVMLLRWAWKYNGSRRLRTGRQAA